MAKKKTTAPAKGRMTAAKAAEATKAVPAKAADDTKPKLSLMKAAVAVLEESGEALNTKQMIELAKQKGLWTPGEGKTPEQTLYSAIAREIKAKGGAARFKMVSKGHFKLASRGGLPGRTFRPVPDAPHREGKVHSVKDGSRIQLLLEVHEHPCDVHDRPKVETRDPLLDVQRRPDEGQRRQEPKSELEERITAHARTAPSGNAPRSAADGGRDS